MRDVTGQRLIDAKYYWFDSDTFFDIHWALTILEADRDIVTSTFLHLKATVDKFVSEIDAGLYNNFTCSICRCFDLDEIEFFLDYIPGIIEQRQLNIGIHIVIGRVGFGELSLADINHIVDKMCKLGGITELPQYPLSHKAKCSMSELIDFNLQFIVQYPDRVNQNDVISYVIDRYNTVLNKQSGLRWLDLLLRSGFSITYATICRLFFRSMYWGESNVADICHIILSCEARANVLLDLFCWMLQQTQMFLAESTEAINESINWDQLHQTYSEYIFEGLHDHSMDIEDTTVKKYGLIYHPDILEFIAQLKKYCSSNSRSSLEDLIQAVTKAR